MKSKERMKRKLDMLKEIIYETKGNKLKNLCDEITSFIHIAMKEEGFDSVIIIGCFKTHPDGEYHLWNLIEGIPVDLTLSQFGEFETGIIEEEFYIENYEEFAEEECPMKKRNLSVYFRKLKHKNSEKKNKF